MPAVTDPPGKCAAEASSVSSVTSAGVRELRRCWELASVLNFWHVFRPVIKSEIKVAAEEIEAALVTPNDTLAELHIALLKGIPPPHKKLKEADGWILALSKKLTEWWCWVSVGEYPLANVEGEEVSKYEELNPVTRLMMLKALCEIRALQDDVQWFIDDAIKSGSELSNFRKNRIGGDQNGTAYWCDGDSVVGYRLYKEVRQIRYRRKVKGKDRCVPDIGCEWETLATNIEEFSDISDNLVSSKAKVESAVGNHLKIEVIPLLVELQKKKERELKRKRRAEMFLDAYREVIGTNRPRRTCKHVNYSYDEYDRSIVEAIKLANEDRPIKEQTSKGDDSNGVLAGEGIPHIGNGSAAVEVNDRESSEDDFPELDQDGEIEDKDDDYIDGVVDVSSMESDDSMNSEYGRKKATKRHVGLRNSRALQNAAGLRRSARHAACAPSSNEETLNLRNRTVTLAKERPLESPSSSPEVAETIYSDPEVEEVGDDSPDEQRENVSDSDPWSSE